MIKKNLSWMIKNMAFFRFIFFIVAFWFLYPVLSFAENRSIHLTVHYKTVNFTGQDKKAIAVNNQIPAPTLHFKEGDTVTLFVENKLDKETAIHWHGLLVAWQMDGVLGGVVGESVMARFVTHYGWRETLFGCAIFAFTLSCLAAFLVRDPVRMTTAVENNSWQNLLCVIRLPQAWVNGLVTGCIFAILASFAGLWCVPYLMHHYHVSLHQAADGSSLIFIGAALGAPFLGWLSDHLCIRKTLMIIFSGLMLFIMLIILYIHLSFAWINFYLLLLGFTSGVYVLPFAVMRDITPHHVKGTAMGYTNMMCIIIGAPLLTPMVGWILTLQPNQYRTSLVVFPISLLFALILSFFVRETYCQSTTGDK